MPSLMQRGLSFLAGKLPAAAGGSIQYAAGLTVVSLTATFGKTAYEADVGGVVRVLHTDRDFIVDRTELGATPVPGHQITDVASGEVFEVLTLDDGACYRPCDAQGTMIRIHAKKIA